MVEKQEQLYARNDAYKDDKGFFYDAGIAKWPARILCY